MRRTGVAELDVATIGAVLYKKGCPKYCMRQDPTSSLPQRSCSHRDCLQRDPPLERQMQELFAQPPSSPTSRRNSGGSAGNGRSAILAANSEISSILLELILMSYLGLFSVTIYFGR
jgi:hypothetical protein